MAITEDTPTFNLKAVVKETGIKPDTLRAWERRYGLPEPERSQGGHRIYSQHDIETLKWLLDRQDEGLSISRAVDLWNSLLNEGKDPLMTAPYVHTDAAISIEPGKALDDLRQAWMQACLTFDERSAEAILTQAFAVYPPEAVTQFVLQRGLAEIGQEWYRGNVTVQQEHFATELALRRLEAQVAAAPPPSRSGRILIACPPGEEHTFPGLLMTFLLRRAGWDVIYLGANVPIAELNPTLEKTRPKLVILSAQGLPTAATLAQMAEALVEHGYQVAYGGGVFVRIPELTQRVAGHYLGNQIDQIHNQVEQIFSISDKPKRPSPIPQSTLDMLALFRRKHTNLEIALQLDPDLQAIHPDHLAIANWHLSRNIIAALSLGDVSFLQNDLTWIQGLLSNLSIPIRSLMSYLQSYGRAIEETLGEPGRVLNQTLTQIELPG